MPISSEALRAKARSVLEANRVGSWTKPAPHLYPHLWSWDSAFIAIGLLSFDPEAARREYQTLMQGQWSNGMVPHIRFDTSIEGEYFPDHNFWGCDARVTGISNSIRTSGILQPPVHALAATRLRRAGVDLEAEDFDRLFAWHHYLMQVRDSESMGGITIVHPWESGMDNSPRWDRALFGYELKEKPEYKRVDRERVEHPEDRPGDDEYDRYVDLVLRLKSVDYRVDRLPTDYPFQIKDVAMSAMFAAANRELIPWAKELGKNSERRALEGYQLRVLDQWDKTFLSKPEAARPWYVDRDMVRGQGVELFSCAGALAVLTDPASLEAPEAWIEDLCRGPFAFSDAAKRPLRRLVASTAPQEREVFRPNLYWRGPVWINIQWLLTQGLDPESPIAKQIRQSSLELVQDVGFYEYFDPVQGTGHGTDGFSWTAALVLDWLEAA